MDFFFQSNWTSEKDQMDFSEVQSFELRFTSLVTAVPTITRCHDRAITIPGMFLIYAIVNTSEISSGQCILCIVPTIFHWWRLPICLPLSHYPPRPWPLAITRCNVRRRSMCRRGGGGADLHQVDTCELGLLVAKVGYADNMGTEYRRGTAPGPVDVCRHSTASGVCIGSAVCQTLVLCDSWRCLKQPECYVTPVRRGHDSTVFESHQLTLPKFWIDSTHDTSGFQRNWTNSAHDSSGVFIKWFESAHDPGGKHTILILFMF